MKSKSKVPYTGFRYSSLRSRYVSNIVLKHAAVDLGIEPSTFWLGVGHLADSKGSAFGRHVPECNPAPLERNSSPVGPR